MSLTIVSQNSLYRLVSLVGLPGFEPGSIAPEATSLDQTSRQPLSLDVCGLYVELEVIKISVPQLEEFLLLLMLLRLGFFGRFPRFSYDIRKVFVRF